MPESITAIGLRVRQLDGKEAVGWTGDARTPAASGAEGLGLTTRAKPVNLPAVNRSARLRCAVRAPLARLFGVGVALGSGLSSLAAGATPQEIALSVGGSVTCASEVELARVLEGHLPGTRVRGTGEGGDAPQVRIAFFSASDSIRAEVSVNIPGAQASNRTLVVRDCSEAVLASGFVAAVLVDPSVGGHGSGVSSVGAGETGAGAGGTEQGLGEQSAQREGGAGGGAPPEFLIPETATQRPRRARSKAHRAGKGVAPPVVSGRALAVVDTGAAPNPLWGMGLGVNFGARAAGLWAPSGGLSFGYRWADPSLQPAGTAQFELGLFSLELCPSQAVLGRARGALCLSARGGWMSSTGVDTFQPTSVVRPWFDLGPSFLGTVSLVGPVGLTVDAGLGVPLVRDTFRFDTDVFHQVPPAVFHAAFGFSVDFF